MSNNQRNRFNIRTVLFFITFGVAIVNIWYASRAIGLGSASSHGESSYSLTLIQQVNDYVSVMGSGNDQPAAGMHADDDQSSSSPIIHDYNFNFTIGICAIVKDGEAYMTEWIDYHLDAMNIESIYIYDDSYNFELQAWYRKTRSHPLYRRVEVMHLWDGEMAARRDDTQEWAYTDCVLRYGKNIQQQQLMEHSEQKGWTATDRMLDVNDGMDYLAFIDIDEFLVPKGHYTSVHGVIKDYLDPYTGGSMTVNWMLFGSSNRTLYTPIPITKRFQYREEVPNGVVKSIVQASDFHSMKSSHSVNTLQGYPRTTSYRGAMLNTSNNEGASDPNLPSGALLLHHYIYMSHKEYYYKRCLRTGTMPKTTDSCSHITGKLMSARELDERGMPIYNALRTGSMFDDSAWKLLTERVPKYRSFDEWADYT